jgi:hypothetical protein
MDIIQNAVRAGDVNALRVRHRERGDVATFEVVSNLGYTIIHKVDRMV